MKVQIMGYTTQVKKVTVSKDFVVDMHFVMEEESIMTDEVVVSANRNETSRKVAPVVVNVMSNKLFEIVNSTDLAKSLNYQSGLRVENNCQNCGFPQVRINGLAKRPDRSAASFFKRRRSLSCMWVGILCTIKGLNGLWNSIARSW